MSIREREPPGQGKYLAGGDLLQAGGEGAPPQMGIEVEDLPNRAETEDNGKPDGGNENWLQLARDAYEFSTSYIDSNYRKKWEDGIRAFNNMHAMDSKYSSPNFSKRSNIFRPKTRSIIRKNEAAASQAFFSNPDVITCEANNQADKAQIASAEVMKQLIQYRLEKSIPWYLTVMGGVQDAQTVGVVCSHQYWKYEEKDGEVIEDKPCVDLVAVENLRIDPASDWRDPVESSPYVIELIPMYIGDLMTMMEKEDPKTGRPKWKKYGIGVIKTAMESKTDSTRITRQKDRGDPFDPTSQAISDYEIVWVQRHIHRKDGEDWTFYTLADVCLLTDPVRLKEVVHHGKRPYVLGCAIIETHKIMSSGIPEISAGLQRETNEIANARLDNIYFVLNKKWLVRRGQNTDLPSLVRNVPGGITLTNHPEDDIKEINWPDVTASAYQEQDRLNADFADLTGDFSANQAQIARKGQEPAKIMALQAQSGTPLTEYLLRTIVVTWMEKVLRQLVLLEQEYETDQTVLAIAGQKAKLLQKFGIDRVTDQMLKAEMTIRVNVGMGATDPFQKLQKLLMGVTQFKEIATQAPPGLSLTEVAKEIFGLLGYQDGARFFGDQDPEKVQLKAQLQHAGQIIQELGKRHEDKQKEHETKAQIAHEGNLTSIVTAAMSKDPHLARVILQKIGPGQGLMIPEDLPPIEDGNKEDPQKEEKAAAMQKQEAERGRTHELIKTKYEGDVKMKMEREKREHEAKLKERELQHQKDLAEAARKHEMEKVEAPMKAEQKKNEPLTKAVEALMKVTEQSAEATKKLAEVLTKPVVKEATFTKTSDGGFKMTATEKVK